VHKEVEGAMMQDDMAVVEVGIPLLHVGNPTFDTPTPAGLMEHFSNRKKIRKKN
jgi:hypothetical protein